MKILKDGREYFDGEVVGIHEARFTGNFTLAEAEGAPMSNDDLVTFIVTARVETPKFTHSKKKGEVGVLKRSNTLRVDTVVPLDREKAQWMYDNLGLEVTGINDELPEEPNGWVEKAEADVAQVTMLVDDYFGSVNARQ
jgi:hypothetical protein